jgi:flagellar biosynthesis GTPase FlhF
VRRARYLRNRDAERDQQRIYREQNGEQIRAQQRAYRARKRDEINARRRALRAADPEKYRQRDRARRTTPEERARAVEKTRRWVAENKERHREWSRNYRTRKINTDPLYKAQHAMRRRFYMALRNQVYDGWNIRSGEAVRLLGCTMAEFVSHVESLWLPGMSWDNWSRDGWHIDHIMPMAAFDLTDEGQRKKACHYTNLRPLWAKDNLAKGSKVAG